MVEHPSVIIGSVCQGDAPCRLSVRVCERRERWLQCDLSSTSLVSAAITGRCTLGGERREEGPRKLMKFPTYKQATAADLCIYSSCVLSQLTMIGLAQVSAIFLYCHFKMDMCSLTQKSIFLLEKHFEVDIFLYFLNVFCIWPQGQYKQDIFYKDPLIALGSIS